MSKENENGVIERVGWDYYSQGEPSDRRVSQKDTSTLELELACEVAAREQLEHRYCSFLEEASIGIYQMMPNGRIISANPALAQLLGYDSPAQLKAAIANLKQQLYVDPQQNQHFMELMYQEGSLSDFQSQVYGGDGRLIWISETVRTVTDRENQLICYEGFVTNVTPLKEAEQALRKLENKHNSKVRLVKNIAKRFEQSQTQLRHREKLSTLGQLLAEVTHEINNPINFVCGNLNPTAQYAQDLLLLLQLYQKHYPEPDPEITEFTQDIDLEFIIDDLPKTLSSMTLGMEKICHLVSSVQSFSRCDDRQIKPVNLHKSLDSTLLILNSRLKAKGKYPDITVIKDYGNLPPTTLCYGCLLDRVFMNLIANGIDAIEERFCQGKLAEEPTLHIQTRVADDGAIIIRIRDNGAGMSDEIQSHIFESFFTTKPTGKGTGLGLSICHEIVADKHGGQLTCVSAPGEGTEFTVTIPFYCETNSNFDSLTF
ncbi:MAG: ATP-binding protein [Cyanobacteriota bacterium]|nr:ATP-binding protein [Cyanobacteriota bacterium]